MRRYPGRSGCSATAGSPFRHRERLVEPLVAQAQKISVVVVYDRIGRIELHAFFIRFEAVFVVAERLVIVSQHAVDHTAQRVGFSVFERFAVGRFGFFRVVQHIGRNRSLAQEELRVGREAL